MEFLKLPKFAIGVVGLAVVDARILRIDVEHLFSVGMFGPFGGFDNGRAAQNDHCGPCTLPDKCLRKPETTKTRQVSFFYGKASGTALA